MTRLLRLTGALLLAALAVPVGTPVVAQGTTPAAAPPPTLQQLNQPRPPEGMLPRREQVRVDAARASEDRRTHCLRAFGHPGFCGCLVDQLPADVSFLTYIQIVASTREELGYARLGKEDQKMVEQVGATRDACVARAFSGQQGQTGQ